MIQVPPLRSNRITLIRLLCAVAVVLSHLDWFAGNDSDPFRHLGMYSVAIFFGLSGFLLTDSISRKQLSFDFIRDRFFRIYPGYLVNLICICLLFSPLYQIIVMREFAYHITVDNLYYFFANISTVSYQTDINDNLKSSSVPIWNPPLWTLSYEITCYFLLFLFVRILNTNFFKFLLFFIPILILGYFSIILFFREVLDERISFSIYYSSFFFLGSLLYRYRVDQNKRNIFIISLVLVISVLIPSVDYMEFFGFKDFMIGLALIPFSLFLAFNPKSNFVMRNDYSYGVYIYSAPVTQTLILIFPDLRTNWFIMAITCSLGSLFFAFFSWHFVEKPSLRFKSRYSSGKLIGRVI